MAILKGRRAGEAAGNTTTEPSVAFGRVAATSEETASSVRARSSRTRLERVTIRFAGDSGDGIQITGNQFTNTTAILGNDLATFPDFPAEIRAPAGTLPGVSGFQVQFSSKDIHTPGDRPDVLVAFNPAALKVHVKALPQNGIIIANTDEFTETNLRKAGYSRNPLEDGSLDRYRLLKVPVTTLTLKALENEPIEHKAKARCKNFFCLGMMYWLFSRPTKTTEDWLRAKFRARPEIAEANIKALRAGHAFAETSEVFQVHYEVPPASLPPGLYRNVSGTTAFAMGLLVGARKAGLRLVYCSYPITPASDMLQELATYKEFGVITFQAEDEIAAVSAAVGASFGGQLGVTGSSGPGIALKMEAINLAVMAELPLVVCDIMRAGPSTGMPTKTEQGDLLQALFGRPSEAPVAVLAPSSPGDCFDTAVEAVRLATRYMTPVFILSDLYLAFGSEPWRIPDLAEIEEFKVTFVSEPEGFAPYTRDPKTLARPWVKPGTPGLEHRIGGLEKEHIYGNVSYDPDNHDLMVKLRHQKIERIAQEIPPAEVTGPDDARLLVLGWGSTAGHIQAAVEECQRRGMPVARAHLRYLNPLPANLGTLLSRYERVLVPEINLGQLRMILRARYLVDVSGLNQVSGQPFKVSQIVEGIEHEFETM